MKLLVTGGAGFIGSNFIHYWLEKYPEDKIVNLDKLTYAGDLNRLKEFKGIPNYKFVKGDICDVDVVNETMGDVDIVVHFAAETHVDRSIHGAADFINTNFVGTYILLEAAKDNGVSHFHHVSTDEVFGSLDVDSKEKWTEETVYDPSSPYSASKAASDHLVRSYFYTYGLPTTITNCSNNFGPWMHPEKLIPRFITKLLNDEKLPVYGDGLNVRDWLYVTDHCRAIDSVIKKGKEGETYLVGGQKDGEINNLKLTKMIVELMGKDESYIEYVTDRPGHDRKYAVDWTKINEELGWEPEHNFKEWLKVTIDWYRENEWWWKPLREESEAFYRRLKYGK